ncbi:VOC family protein [Nocardioides immobilis]|uniref:VOC family protein n=1 Tax=Nocardioides immobilis TaxID=2049295 RepID=UPI0015FD290C|nr:VOC family protein [Nocardioides immobilis]
MTAVLSISHVGLLTPDIEGCVQRWELLFNAGRTELRPTWYASDEEVLATFLPFGSCSIEPIQPMRPDTIQGAALAAGRPAFHLSVKVADIHETVRNLRSRGVWVQLRPPGRTVTLHRGWLDESSTHGVTLELIDAGEVASFRPPPAAGSAPPPEPTTPSDRPTLRSVALRVDDLDAARDFYAGDLGLAEQRPVQDAEVLGVPVRHAAVRAPEGLTVELFEYASERSVPALPAQQGISHVTLTTADLELLRARLHAAEALMTDDSANATGDAAGLWVHSRTTGGLVVHVLAETDTAS